MKDNSKNSLNYMDFIEIKSNKFCFFICRRKNCFLRMLGRIEFEADFFLCTISRVLIDKSPFKFFTKVCICSTTVETVFYEKPRIRWDSKDEQFIYILHLISVGKKIVSKTSKHSSYSITNQFFNQSFVPY